jgi:hypothetical protein
MALDFAVVVHSAQKRTHPTPCHSEASFLG